MEQRKERKEPLKRADLILAIDALKGSVNRMMIPSRHNPKKWVYAGGYRKQKEKMVQELQANHAELKDHFFGFETGHYVVCTIDFVDKWLTKTSGYRKFRKKDVTNYVKNIEDVISKFMGFDDSMITTTVLNKEHLSENHSSGPCLRIILELYEM